MKSKIKRLTLILIVLVFNTICVSARDYLVSVGINDYSSFPVKLGNLLLPVSDAKAVANLYANHGAVDYVLITNQDATKNKIINAMKKVYSKSTSSDHLIFFFSGHGYADGVCASDGKLAYDEIKVAIRDYPCDAKIVFIDACNSGGIRKNSNSKESHKGNNSQFVFFLASRTNESSIERKDMTNGFFTEYLIKGLKGNADVNRDRQITTKELFDFVQKRVVVQSGERQHPVMWGNYSDSTVILKW